MIYWVAVLIAERPLSDRAGRERKVVRGDAYVVAMARQGERSTVFAFDETLGIMSARAEALGLPLRAQIKSGTVTARQIDPAEISPGEFAWTVSRSVEEGCKLVVIDSLNGY